MIRSTSGYAAVQQGAAYSCANGHHWAAAQVKNPPDDPAARRKIPVRASPQLTTSSWGNRLNSEQLEHGASPSSAHPQLPVSSREVCASIAVAFKQVGKMDEEAG